MSALALIHMDGHWLSFDGTRAAPLPARPKLDRAAIAITDFDGAVTQVIALEGSPSHAIALIEKRLRSEGLVDNEVKILIHQIKRVGNGYQALFTAVPLDRWQQLFAWAEGQPDHCLLVPAAGLLWSMLKPGRGVLLHAGRQFVFMASLRNRIVFASALAFSESDNDLSMTVAALGERAGRELADEDSGLEPLTVEWLSVLEPAAASAPAEPPIVAIPSARAAQAIEEQPITERIVADEDAFTYEGQFDRDPDMFPDEGGDTVAAPPRVPATNIAGALAGTLPLHEVFAAHSGATVQAGAQATVLDADGKPRRTGALRLAAAANAMVAVNPVASRCMYVAERLLPWASAASLVVALGLAGLGGRWALAAHNAQQRAAGIDTDVAQIEARIASLQTRQRLPAAYARQLRFIARAGGLGEALDPVVALATIRDAAGDDVRILRVRLTPPPPAGPRPPGAMPAPVPAGGPAAGPAPAAHEDVLRVDGMVKHGAGSDAQGMQVARFVERLRAAGYEPVAVDPQSTTSRAQSPGGSFSYELRRAPAQAAGGAP